MSAIVLSGLRIKTLRTVNGSPLSSLLDSSRMPSLTDSFTGGIAKERELDLSTRDVQNVLDPSAVRFSIVTGVATQLDVFGSKLGFEAGSPSEFGSADGCEVTGMHQDAPPRVSEILVEVKVIRELRSSLQVRELKEDKDETKTSHPCQVSLGNLTLSLRDGPPMVVVSFAFVR